MIAFVHIEKTAGISINRLLQGSYGICHCDVETIEKNFPIFNKVDLDFAQRIHPCLKSIAGHTIRPYVEYGLDLQYFTFFRNPIDRTLSHYQYQVQRMGKKIDYRDWIKNEKYRNFQTKKIAGKPDFDLAKKMIDTKFICIGITERFEDSIKVLNDKLGGGLSLISKKRNMAVNNSLVDQVRNDKELMNETYLANQEDLKTYQYALSINNTYHIPSKGVDLNTISIQNNAITNQLFRTIVYKTAIKLRRRINF